MSPAHILMQTEASIRRQYARKTELMAVNSVAHKEPLIHSFIFENNFDILSASLRELQLPR